MKHFALFILVLMTCLCGCSLYPQPVDPLCAKPEYAGSVICAIAAKTGTSPEQMDTMLLDASILPVAVKKVQAADMLKAIDKVRVWVGTRDILTMAGISAYLSEQAKVDPALALLLSRRLPMFASLPGLSDKMFLPVDRQLVLAHLDHQAAQFKLL